MAVQPMPSISSHEMTLLVHWGVSLGMMVIAWLFYMRAGFYAFRLVQRRVKLHSMLVSMMQLAVPDLFLCLNYGLVYIVSIYEHQLISGPACEASAFIICSSILGSNLGGVCLAYTMQQAMKSKQHVTNMFQLIWMLASWLAGVAISSYYISENLLGQYRGLYCSTVTYADYAISVPIFCSFAVSMVGQLYFYNNAFKFAKAASKGSGIKDATQHVDAKLVVLRFSVQMCTVYWLSWSLVSVVSIMQVAGFVTYPDILDVLASIFIKVSPLCNSFIVSNAFQKVYERKLNLSSVRDSQKSAFSSFPSKQVVQHYSSAVLPTKESFINDANTKNAGKYSAYPSIQNNWLTPPIESSSLSH